MTGSSETSYCAGEWFDKNGKVVSVQIDPDLKIVISVLFPIKSDRFHSSIGSPWYNKKEGKKCKSTWKEMTSFVQ